LKQELFDEVCQLREKRLDLEELVLEEKRTLDQLKKDSDGLIKKKKIADMSLEQVKNELENFQVIFLKFNELKILFY
jgi:cilia- and flagella-associated protein 44